MKVFAKVFAKTYTTVVCNVTVRVVKLHVCISSVLYKLCVVCVFFFPDTVLKDFFGSFCFSEPLFFLCFQFLII